jgi:LDH2 family malate/lactate/ureidoglycolate dehydrogenase
VAGTSAESLKNLLEALLVAGGADARDAQTTAEVWCWADERERHPQGSVWVEPFLARLAAGTLVSPAPVAVRRVSPATVHVDAGHGFGPVAGHLAVDLVTATALDVGVGLVTVVDSTHFGAAGHYAARIAERGLLGVVCTNAYPKVAAHGGTRPVLGTNPIAFSVPVAGGDVVIGDLSTGALAGSRVREAIERGERLPEGTALDALGSPTTDPSALERGGVMLPAAGPKGFALGLMVELLTSVLGAGSVAGETGSMFEPAEWVRVSHTFLAFTPMDDDFASRAAAFLTHVVQADGGAAVRIPGRDRERAAARAREHGIELPPASVAALRRSADRLGVPLPPDLCAVTTP